MSWLAGLARTVGAVLGGLALLHAYWGLVGISGRSLALPEVDGRPVLQPTRLACFAVAAALATAAMLVLASGGVVPPPFPAVVTRIGTVGLGLAFLLRAIGDFRLVGFFKRVRGSRFATWDSRLFSPLCLALGVASLWIALA
jgi:quinol-cytochrome oxidoreductase complex cytochrome b subunit